MGNEPRGLEGAAKGAVKLVAADPLFRRRHEEDCLQPVAHGDVASLEYRPDLHGKGLAALVALVRANAGALAAHLADPVNSAAVRANRAVSPNARLDEGIGCGFVM